MNGAGRKRDQSFTYLSGLWEGGSNNWNTGTGMSLVTKRGCREQ